jgi:hypothetical protein
MLTPIQNKAETVAREEAMRALFVASVHRDIDVSSLKKKTGL